MSLINESTPSTPVRPPRSIRRLTAESLPALDGNPFDPFTPPPLPSLTTSNNDDTPYESTPVTPSTPKTPTRPKLANRKSTASIRRKPVPRTSEELRRELEETQNGESEHGVYPPLPHTQSPLPDQVESSTSQPPRFILPVDPPFPSASTEELAEQDTPRQGEARENIDFSASRPPSYAGDGALSPAYAPRPTEDPLVDMTGGLGPGAPSSEDLPTYAEETQTEPHTLARALFRWGFLCPLLWFIGVCIMWIPLKPVEEERDPEKAQKLDEMIFILRKTELKYAKRCGWCLLGFTILLIAIIVIAVVVSMKG